MSWQQCDLILNGYICHIANQSGAKTSLNENSMSELSIWPLDHAICIFKDFICNLNALLVEIVGHCFSMPQRLLSRAMKHLKRFLCVLVGVRLCLFYCHLCVWMGPWMWAAVSLHQVLARWWPGTFKCTLLCCQQLLKYANDNCLTGWLAGLGCVWVYVAGLSALLIL